MYSHNFNVLRVVVCLETELILLELSKLNEDSIEMTTPVKIQANEYESGSIITFKKLDDDRLLVSVDNRLYMLSIMNRTMVKLIENEEEFDPIISINKVRYGKSWIAILNTLRCLVIAVDIYLGTEIGKIEL